MPTRHKWDRGNDYVEIGTGVSTDLSGGAFVVNTNLPEGLSLDFNAQVPASEEKDLVSKIDHWLVPKGFRKTQ